MNCVLKVGLNYSLIYFNFICRLFGIQNRSLYFAHCHHKVTGMLNKWLERILLQTMHYLNLAETKVISFIVSKIPDISGIQSDFLKITTSCKKKIYVKKKSVQNSKINPPWHASGGKKNQNKPYFKIKTNIPFQKYRNCKYINKMLLFCPLHQKSPAIFRNVFATSTEAYGWSFKTVMISMIKWLSFGINSVLTKQCFEVTNNTV